MLIKNWRIRYDVIKNALRIGIKFLIINRVNTSLISRLIKIERSWILKVVIKLW